MRRLATAAALVVSLALPSPVAAAGDDARSVVRAFLTREGYRHVAFRGPSIYGTCPRGMRCRGWVALVRFTVSANPAEGGAVALVRGGVRCPRCGSVLTAGGGSLGVPELVRYGVPQREARDMIDRTQAP